MRGLLAQLQAAWKGAAPAWPAYAPRPAGPGWSAVPRHLVWALWPTACHGCQQVAVPGGALGLCEACSAALQQNDGVRCSACDAPNDELEAPGWPQSSAATTRACGCPLGEAWRAGHFAGTRAPWRYTGPIARAIVAGKYRGARGVFEALGAACADDAMVRAMAATVDAVTYVPTTRQRARTRGFDAGAVLAHSLARALKLSCVDTLVRVDAAPSRSLQAGRAARGAPPKLRARVTPGARLLLVDDVCTTGTTLAAAVDALRAAGAASLAAVVAARRP